MRVCASEGARYPEGDKTGNGGWAALKGRKGEMTRWRAREGKGVGYGREIQEGKSTRGREKQSRAVKGR